jgi:hypothetical protein
MLTDARAHTPKSCSAEAKLNGTSASFRYSAMGGGARGGRLRLEPPPPPPPPRLCCACAAATVLHYGVLPQVCLQLPAAAALQLACSFC